MREQDLQNQIRMALSKLGVTCFRGNVGQAWTGDEIIKLHDGGILIPNARPFNTGLPAGFSDIFGLVPVFVTHEMVGKTLGVFTVIEVKTPTGRVTTEQKHFLSVMAGRGAITGVARSVENAARIVQVWGLSQPDQ